MIHHAAMYQAAEVSNERKLLGAIRSRRAPHGLDRAPLYRLPLSGDEVSTLRTIARTVILRSGSTRSSRPYSCSGRRRSSATISTPARAPTPTSLGASCSQTGFGSRRIGLPGTVPTPPVDPSPSSVSPLSAARSTPTRPAGSSWSRSWRRAGSRKASSAATRPIAGTVLTALDDPCRCLRKVGGLAQVLQRGQTPRRHRVQTPDRPHEPRRRNRPAVVKKPGNSNSGRSRDRSHPKSADW